MTRALAYRLGLHPDPPATSPATTLLDYHYAADGFMPFDLDAWVARLRAAGWVGNPRRRPRGPIVVWRGQSDARRLGISWSRDRFTATHFARRHVAIAETVDGATVTATVWRAVAPLEAVLGVGHDDIGEEGEMLVDPALLTDVRAVAVVTGRGARPCC